VVAEHNDRRRRGGAPRSALGGFTLLEVGITIVILMLSVASTSAATISLATMREHHRERMAAHEAASGLAERILELGRSEMGASGSWARNVTESVCEPNGLGVAFDVAGLEPLDSLAHVGSITFVVDETVTDADLGVPLGMPRDLDGNGYIDGTNVHATARLLPAVIELRWNGVRGEQRLVHPFLVVGY
jgi:Tfp pilus assembly protein PilV